MRLWVEEDNAKEIGEWMKDKTIWRWICECGMKGHWQDLSYNNSFQGAKTHFESRHQFNNVVYKLPRVQFSG